MPGVTADLQPLPEWERIPFDALEPPLRAELSARHARLGYLGDFFQLAAHQPDALLHFNRFTETLKAALPPNLGELCALTVAQWSGNAYERVQHERLSLKLGLGEAWVRAVLRLSPDDAPGLSEVERAAQRLVLAAAQTMGREAGALAAELGRLTDQKTVTAVLLCVGRYLAHAAFCNTLGARPPVASPLEGAA